MIRKNFIFIILLHLFCSAKAKEQIFRNFIDTTIKGYKGASHIKVSCFDKERKEPGKEDPEITTTCYIKNYKVVKISSPDYAGRYIFDEYKVFRKSNGKYVKISNFQMFNKKQDELTAILNEKTKTDFIQVSTDSNTKECFQEGDTLRVFTINDFGISFDKDEIWFNIDFGLRSGYACMSVQGTVIAFKLKEIEKYLR